MRVAVLALAGAVFWSVAAGATTYLVRPDGSGDFPTVQAALDGCADGDVIELVSGVFQGEGNRDLDFRGRAVLLGAQAGGGRDCVIDCQGSEGDPHRGFHFHSGEGPGSVVRGIFVRGGYASHGGGLWCEGTTSPSFVECIFAANQADNGGGASVDEAASFTRCAFEENEATWAGGGVKAYGPAELRDCVFRGNTARHGGGLYLYWSSARVDGCSFMENRAGGGGAGAHCEMPSAPAFTRCTFVGNVAAYHGGGVNVQVECAPVLSGCTFAFNSAFDGGGLRTGSLCSAVVENTLIAFSVIGAGAVCQENDTQFACCDLYGNDGGDWVDEIAGQFGLRGNIAADPLFCDPAGGDLRLEAGSPCGPEHNPACGLIGAWPVGCGSSVAPETTWGAIKAIFRR